MPLGQPKMSVARTEFSVNVLRDMVGVQATRRPRSPVTG